LHHGPPDWGLEHWASNPFSIKKSMNATETAIERDIYYAGERGKNCQEIGCMMSADEILQLQEVDMLTSEPQLPKTFNSITPNNTLKIGSWNFKTLNQTGKVEKIIKEIK
jgi:hypothetical protein